MFEKDLSIAFLLDFYGDVLSERKRTVLDYYYNDDLSLSEVAEEIGISRQGVRELIKKAEEELRFYEEKLGLAKRFSEVQVAASRLQDLLQNGQGSEELIEAVHALSEAVRS